MQNTCKQCGQKFEITDEDLAFYDKISPSFCGKKEPVSPPTRCADCRLQQRFAWRNDRKLYHRKCNLTGKQIISCYSPNKLFNVYEQHEWWGDTWDALDYGRPFDFSRPFFEQWADLLHTVPIPSLHTEQTENSDYGNFNWGAKNCYLLFASDNCEDCHYSHMLFDCTDCMDCIFCKECAFCYQLLDSEKCYRCFYSSELTNCESVDFSIDCKNCRSCFGCTGLRSKEFYLFNQSLTKDEYARKLQELTLTMTSIQLARERAMELWRKQPRLASHLLLCENCTGDNLQQCKNCRHCFDGRLAEDCAYCQNIPTDAKDCHDEYGVGRGAELDYQGYCVAGQRTLFSFLIYPSGSDILYSGYCGNCDHVFGCIGLKRKKYCILNKQYTKEEYEKLLPKIIEHMRKAGEWGEFFPAPLSPFCYNETLAQEYFPLTKNDAKTQGLSWYDEEERHSYMGPAVPIPERIQDADDSICGKILQCEVSGKPFKIIPQELKFYRDMKLPIPRKCPDQRHIDRMALRNPRKLWKRECAKCQKPIETTYSPDRPEIVYCEECYLKEVY